MSKFSFSRRAAVAAVATAALAAGLGAAAVTTASASPVSTGATGTTSIAFGGPGWNAFAASGCGTPYVSGNNGVTVTTTGHQTRVNFPISDVQYDQNYAAFRIENSGSVTFSNYCYDITFSAVRVTNFGNPGQTYSVDVSAVNHSYDDNVGRAIDFTMDFTNAVTSYPGPSTVKTEKIDLFLANEGAEEFNELCYCYAFNSGQPIGNSRITVKY
jgi:hypothetical protein